MLLQTLSALVRLHELKCKTDVDNQRSSKEIKRCRSEIPNDILKKYDILWERFGKTALVPLKNKTCTGCYIKQPIANLSDLGHQIYQCHHCRRMMYFPDDLYEESGF